MLFLKVKECKMAIEHEVEVIVALFPDMYMWYYTHTYTTRCQNCPGQQFRSIETEKNKRHSRLNLSEART